jgi:hypothetical protein
MVSCSSCGREFSLVTAFVAESGSAIAIVYAACHSHADRNEAWLDVTVGSFEEPDFADQATFSCRARTEGATLFPALVAVEGRAPSIGKKLTVDEAHAHMRLPDVWALIDFMVTTEPTVRACVYEGGNPPQMPTGTDA